MSRLDGYSNSLDDASSFTDTREELPEFLKVKPEHVEALESVDSEVVQKSVYDEARETAELLKHFGVTTKASPVMDVETAFTSTRTDLPEFVTSQSSSIVEQEVVVRKSPEQEARETAELLAHFKAKSSNATLAGDVVDSGSMESLSSFIDKALAPIPVKEIEIPAIQLPPHNIMRANNWNVRQDIAGTKVYTHKSHPGHEVYVLPNGVNWEHHLIKGVVLEVQGLGQHVVNLRKHIDDFHLLNKQEN